MLILPGWFYLFDKSMRDKSMTSNIRALGRLRLAMLAVIVLVVMVLAAGNLFAANERENPDVQPVGEQPQLNGIDPGLDYTPPAVVSVESAMETLRIDGKDPGVNQEVPESGGSDPLSRWLAARPDEIGFFTVQDAMSSDSIDVDWMLYQAVSKNVMTEEEAEAFQAWFDQRPSTDDAPELLLFQPANIERLGVEHSATGLPLAIESR